MKINSYRLIPGKVAYWGDIVGNISDQTDLVEYISSHGGGGDAVWGSITGNISEQSDLMNLVSSFATESWVESQGYLSSAGLDSYLLKSNTSGNVSMLLSPSNAYIYLANTIYSQTLLRPDMISMIGSSTNTLMRQGEIGIYDSSSHVAGLVAGTTLGEAYLLVKDGEDTLQMGCHSIYTNYSGVETATPISDLATKTWVGSQGYLTSVPSTYATESWVQSQGYLTSIPDTFATKSWVSDQGFLTSIPSEYATESWVTSQGYLTSQSSDFTSLESRVSALESNYSDAVTITNNILS